MRISQAVMYGMLLSLGIFFVACNEKPVELPSPGLTIEQIHKDGVQTLNEVLRSFDNKYTSEGYTGTHSYTGKPRFQDNIGYGFSEEYVLGDSLLCYLNADNYTGYYFVRLYLVTLTVNRPDCQLANSPKCGYIPNTAIDTPNSKDIVQPIKGGVLIEEKNGKSVFRTYYIQVLRNKSGRSFRQNQRRFLPDEPELFEWNLIF